MTNEEIIEQLRDKLNKCAFALGVYSGSLFQIKENVPDKLEFDGLKEQLITLLARMNKDIEHLFYGVNIQ